MDNLIIQIKNRPSDSVGRIPVRARLSDKNFITLQNGIQDRSMEIPRLGLITPPELSMTGLTATGMTVYYSAFECLSPYGVKCEIPAGSIGICANVALSGTGLTHRIDVLAVAPLVQKDGDGEIDYSGLIQSIMGITITAHSYVPHIPDSWLKIGEVGISAGNCVSNLRSYIADEVPVPMGAPQVGLTESMRLFVNPFRGHIATNQRVDFEGGFSPLFTPPGTSGLQRIDLLVMDQDAELSIIHGSEVTSPTRPTAPAYPAMQMPIAEVYLQDMDGGMRQDMVSDVRPHFIWPGVPRFTETRWFPAADFWSLKKEPAPDAAEMSGYFPVIYFDDTTEEGVYNSWRLPHRINTESGLTAIISWANVGPAGGGEFVRWGIEYNVIDICDGLTPGMFSGITGICLSILSGCGITSWVRHDAAIPIGITVDAGLTPGGILGFRIFRDATNPLDTMVGDAAFIGVAFEWEGYAVVNRTMTYV